MRSKRSIEAERAQHVHQLVGRRPASNGAKAQRVRQAAVEPSTPITLEPIQVHEGVVSLNGYGVRITIEKGQLLLADGVGNKRREGRFSRATCGIKRLVVRGSAFFITGDALAWLNDIGASFLNIGFDGEILASWSPPGHDDARLRRAQALAPWMDTGPELTKYLLREKLLGQIYVIERYFPHAAEVLSTIRSRLDSLDSLTDAALIRHAEGEAASAYWQTWNDVPVTFIRRDAARIPEHWKTFGSRVSPLSNRPSQAINPANAALNLVYSVAAAETRVACLTAGLDPGIGLFHTDALNRDSLVFDVMEPVRPQVDAWLLDVLDSRVWTWDDFAEIRDGVCRILPAQAHVLAETATAWYKAVAPYVEHVARTLAQFRPDMPSGHRALLFSQRSGERYPTRLTHANSRWTESREVPSRRSMPAPGPKAPPNACRNCGATLDHRRRRYCADCLKQLREEGTPVSADVETKRRVSQSLRHALRREWEAAHPGPYDEEGYKAAILPRLKTFTIPAISAATGLSLAYSAQIRSGKIPHPAYWDALAKLVGVELYYTGDGG
jgi:CRISPR-associated endonuclease Cas1